MTDPEEKVDLPEPPSPADGNLHEFSFTPIFRARLFGSRFHSRANDAEWRAGVTLWLKSWDQVPAGSLPDDDVDLCRLAELGRDLKAWNKIKGLALYGWYKCSDGLLYHTTVAEGINQALARKHKHQERGAKGAAARWNKQPNQMQQASETDASTTQKTSHKHAKGNGQAMLSDGNRQGHREGEGEVPPFPPLAGMQQASPGREDPAFERFWKTYPHKVSKGHARKAFASALRKVPADAMLSALHRQIAAGLFNREHRPNPGTWLNGERWLDEVVSREDAIMRAAGLGPDLVIDDEPKPEQRSLLQ